MKQALRFAVWCHDIGKASDEWQEYIRNIGSRITHALPSFGVGLMTLQPRRFPNDSPIYASLLAVLAHHGQLHKDAFREDNFRWQNATLPVDYINAHLDFFRQQEHGFKLKTWQSPTLPLKGCCQFVKRLKTAIDENRSFTV